MDLTKKQQLLFDYLQENLGRDGRAPSLRQAADDLGVSRNAVAQLIGQLERKRVIEREGHYSRSIRILQQQTGQGSSARVRELPVVGRITAGLPMYAQQEWDGSVVVDGDLFPGNNLFCLRIQGDSMQDAGILDGDLVVCEPRQYAESGEIVAVLIQEEEATVKRFFLGPDYIELRPENKKFQPTRYPFSDLLVQGKVVGVIRSTWSQASLLRTSASGRRDEL
ncbi:MAG: transcriptional repressor LexA [Proteobacteria bacterium]|nr:transcriptional repressor LexA [Pseudomonadota bacterium]MBU1138493.1 transcriptional repressor LexA [Pseudomonadota bacterium]